MAKEDRSLERLHKKVRTILAERMNGLPDRDPSSDDDSTLREAIQKAFRPQLDERVASDLWFHLADWAWDLEFLVALYHSPEAFTPKEVRDGLEAFLIHAPAHIVQAAKLAGWPVRPAPASRPQTQPPGGGI